MVEADERELILEATKELLEALVQENNVAVGDIASLMFTMTPGGLPRFLMHVKTDRTVADIKHVYLHAAQTLRPEA